MSQLTLNGKSLKLEIPPQTSLKDLVAFLNSQFNNEQMVISSILINGGPNGGIELGGELTDSQESEFGEIPFSDLETIEVKTSYSREVLDDTLQHLLEYTKYLSSLSNTIADLVDQREFHQGLHELATGMTTFSEGIITMKKMLKFNPKPEFLALENEFLALLRKLYDLYQGTRFDRTQQLRQILQILLPANLTQWRTQGIPELVRFSSS